MRFALRIFAFLCVAIALFFFVRSQAGGEPTEEENTAYRDWALKQAEKQYQGWDEYHGIANLPDTRDYDLEPYADPTLFAPGSVVIQAGETWRDEIDLILPGGSENSGGGALGDYGRDPRIHVVRNEWQDHGVEVQIEFVRVDSYVYPTWRVRDGSSEYPLRSLRPSHNARTLGSYTRREIALMQADGAMFNVDDFDAGFDLGRGEGSGWRARVRYRISLPDDLPVNAGDRSWWGQITIAAGSGGDVYKAHLIHLEDHDGVAVRPYRR
jgi:hypothetical protein